jgi:hypothetical protein
MWEYNETVHQLFIGFKKAYGSIIEEVLYNVVIELDVPMKLVRLINICLNEPYIKARIGEHLIRFLFRMHYNKEMLYRRRSSAMI